MSDETKNDLPVEESETTNPVLDAASDLISDATIPAPIRRGVSAVVKRLFSAVIVDPLERGSAEKWAETESRNRIREAFTDEIIQKLEVDPEFPQRALELFGNRILREQFSLEKILGFTTGILKKKKYDDSANQLVNSEAEKTINEDWFNIFEKEASQKSTEDMQHRFAQVLADEIEKPGSHSIKAIKALGNMDQNIAELFQIVCSMSVIVEGLYKNVLDIRIPTLNKDPGTNELLEYGLIFTDILMLIEYDLVAPNYNTRYGYDNCILNKPKNTVTPFQHQGRYWILEPSPERKGRSKFWLSGVQLSSVGSQLFHIIEQIPTQKYTKDLKEYFAKQRLSMVEVSMERGGQGIRWHIIQ